jgi:predicted ribosome quality control (RQC) complex YloA/Tae2 family protein
MQPFDALTMEAVLKEAKPLVLNSRLESVHQLGTDEIFLRFFGRSGLVVLRICAHPVYGRICLSKSASKSPKAASEKEKSSNFLAILRKQLYQANLVGIEQPPGERIVDFVFSCLDAVGTAALKTLTVEIMGRHSNIIFWDRSERKIICASHKVTQEMSRYRQVITGLKYVRPPEPTKPSIWKEGERDFLCLWQDACGNFAGGKLPAGNPPTGEANSTATLAGMLTEWLISKYAGLGKHVAQEIVQACLTTKFKNPDELGKHLFQQIGKVGSTLQFKPAMKLDGSAYTVLSLLGQDKNSEWQVLPTVNDLVEQVYNTSQLEKQFKQLRALLLKETTREIDRLETRVQATVVSPDQEAAAQRAKLFGDLILANLPDVNPGQTELACDNTFSELAEQIAIPLDPKLSGVENARHYYLQYAKTRNRLKTARVAGDDAQARLISAKERLKTIESAYSLAQLPAEKRPDKPAVLSVDSGKMTNSLAADKKQKSKSGKSKSAKPGLAKTKSAKSKLASLASSDGWPIYVGRSRQENDFLISHIAQPKDIWLHVLGHSGSHVLIKVPSARQEPSLTTIAEAAYLAARFSKCAEGAKVNVIYTQAKFVKKVSGSQPGVVRYENEKTIEVDTGLALPKIMEQITRKKAARSSES